MSKANVLVIDDDEIIGRSFDRVLSDRGCNVHSVTSGQAGLDSIDKESYGVVFTDIKMPGMDGFTVAKKIREKYPLTPVVIITGYGSEENEQQATALGVSDFIRKPLNPEQIEAVTSKALNTQLPEAVNDAVNDAVTDAVTETVNSAVNSASRFAKNVGLFFLSPFIALAYIIALPVVGTVMFAKLALEAYRKRND